MKLVCLSLVIFASIFHDVHSGIILDNVGGTLERIKCKTKSVGNRLFHRGQNNDLCDERQDSRPQGHNQYEHDNYNNQRVNGFQIWIPFTNREQGSRGQQNTNYNGGFTEKPNSNNNIGGNIARPFPGNQNAISTRKPLLNLGYGNSGQSVPVEENRSTARPSSNNEENGHGHEGFVQPIPTNQSSGSILGSSSSNVGSGNISKPSSNNQYSESTIIADGRRDESTATNISNQNAGNQYNNCTVIDVRSGNNNQTDVPNNCTQGGRRFLTAVKANCKAGEIADRNGVCREMYRR